MYCRISQRWLYHSSRSNEVPQQGKPIRSARDSPSWLRDFSTFPSSCIPMRWGNVQHDRHLVYRGCQWCVSAANFIKKLLAKIRFEAMIDSCAFLAGDVISSDESGGSISWYLNTQGLRNKSHDVFHIDTWPLLDKLYYILLLLHIEAPCFRPRGLATVVIINFSCNFFMKQGKIPQRMKLF